MPGQEEFQRLYIVDYVDLDLREYRFCQCSVRTAKVFGVSMQIVNKYIPLYNYHYIIIP